MRGYSAALFLDAVMMLRISAHVRGCAASTTSMNARGCLISHASIRSGFPSTAALALLFTVAWLGWDLYLLANPD